MTEDNKDLFKRVTTSFESVDTGLCDLLRRQSSEAFEIQNIDRFYKPKVIVGTEIPLVQLQDMQKLDQQCVAIKRILILYTGGTIGMRMKDGAYEPEPNYLTKALRKLPMFNDSRLRRELPALSDVFIMPRSIDNIRVIFNVWEYNPLLDSSDMTMDDYIRISKDIEREYERYDGFLILHGTDTMSFTGSALSFLLDDLTKPVILTGSQIPLFELRSDGRDNLLDSLLIASHCNIPEVTIYFHQKLFRANRSTKQSSVHFDAFDSPNFPPLAELGININIYHHRLLPRPKGKTLKPVINKLCPEVTVLRVFPSITCETVRAILAPPVEGVVLQTYGSGNMPYCRQDILQCFREAYERGVIIINITQCSRGGVKAIYRTGFVLKEYGILPGLDMTLEAALTKLSYVLSVDSWSIETKRAAVARNLRGEMTTCQFEPSVDVRTFSQDGIFVEENVIIAAALCNAAKEGNLTQLDQLGKRRGDWEAMDYDGRTALHIAASENQTEIVKFLIENNAKLNVTDRYGFTPLKSAVLGKSSVELIHLLSKNGAVLGMDEKATFEVMKELIQNNNVEVLKKYYAAGANVKVKDEHGNTLLHVASMYGRTDIVKWLVDSGLESPSEMAVNNNGNTPAEEALIRDFRKIYDFLCSSSGSSYKSSFDED